MNQNFLKDFEFDNVPSNANTSFFQNSMRNSTDGFNSVNNDNFWAVDPLLLGDQCRVTDDIDLKETLDSPLINVHSKWNTRNDNRNCSDNSSNLFANHNDLLYSNSNDCPLTDSSSYKMLKRCVRKLPLHFIDSKDWQLYLEFAAVKDLSMNQDSKTGCGALPKNPKNKDNKINRLLNSIYNLYYEYSELNNEYELLRKQFLDKFNSLDSLSSIDNRCSFKGPRNRLRTLKTNKRRRSLNIPEKLLLDPLDSARGHFHNFVVKNSDEASQTSPVPEWSELTESQLAEVLKHSDSTNTCHGNTRPSTVTSKRNTSSLSTDIYSSKSKRMKIYDHLTRQSFLGIQSIDIIEELQTTRSCLAHRMNIINTNNICPSNSLDDVSKNDLSNPPNFIFNSIATALRCATSKTGSNSNNGNLQLINLPILMDLMLPKTQLKVQQIFDECPFLNNPLEIMAELRTCNYNKSATIDYFNATKQLRGSIKEFISSTLDSRCNTVVVSSMYPEENCCLNCNKVFPRVEDNIPTKDEDLLAINMNGKCSVDHASFRDHVLQTEMVTKSTDIEQGIFDNAVQDSFSQTLSNNDQLKPHTIQDFVDNILKNVYYLKKSIKESKIQMSHLRRQVSSLLKALKNNIDLIISLSSKQFMTDQHRGRIMLLARQVEELKLKLKDEETKRRAVYNMMQEQMGNVRVYCRCRDVPHSENVLEIQGNESIILPILPQERFDFDNVFSSIMIQSDIYEEFKPLVMSFIDGFNVCFITYGSEASGKTYTLIGGNISNEEDHGIMQRALNTVLTEQKLRNRDWDYKISACLIEIYNDNCIDILSGESGIQLYVDCGMESVYQKLKSVPITNENDAEVLLHLCRSKRKVARTALNPSSSRSHLITLIRLQGKSKIHGENIRSFMCLCDLAGFEDIIKAETQSNKTLAKEAGYINKSLTAFNRVFVSLRRQDPNTVCYRDTKLTHLLKPFLTNSGKCALIITIRTDRKSLSSTQNTLRFGRETRGVSLGKARRQVNNNKTNNN